MDILLALIAVIAPLCLAWFLVARGLKPRERNKRNNAPSSMV